MCVSQSMCVSVVFCVPHDARQGLTLDPSFVFCVGLQERVPKDRQCAVLRRRRKGGAGLFVFTPGIPYYPMLRRQQPPQESARRGVGPTQRMRLLWRACRTEIIKPATFTFSGASFLVFPTPSRLLCLCVCVCVCVCVCAWSLGLHSFVLS